MAKVLSSAMPPLAESVPLVTATPIDTREEEALQRKVAPEHAAVSSEAAEATSFLRQFRVLIGAARLYQRNHPRLMEILASAAHQLRIVLANQSPAVFAVERNGILLPRPGAAAGELLHDPRGELRALAEELLRGGICSVLLAPQVNVGELDLLAHQISQVPRSATPGDTASRKGWDRWLTDQHIQGIRLNVPTERRDSLLLASLVSAVLAYDDTPQRSSPRAWMELPATNFEQVAASLRLLAKLIPPRDSETQTSAEDVARQIHSVLSSSDRPAVALIVRGVSHVKPREGETLEPYLGRLADALMIALARQEFDAGRRRPREIAPLLAQLDRERNEAANGGSRGSRGPEHDELRVATLHERFWNALPAREKGKALRSQDAWCVPVPAVARYVEPLTAAAEKKKAEAAGREARLVLCEYAKCLDSDETQPRQAAAAGLAELSPQIERLWPHPAMSEFSGGILRALLLETSPGIAGMLSAVVENLARLSLAKYEYAEFERILETLESLPEDEAHAHLTTLVKRILNDDCWLRLVDDSLASGPLNPVIPRLLRRSPERVVDRLGLLLTAPQGMDSLPGMVRLVHAIAGPLPGVLDSRLYEPRRQRVAAAVILLASADPKRLAGALSRVFSRWDWGLQDLAVTELSRWTNPSVAEAAARVFLSTLADAHPMVVPCMIDQIGLAQEKSAIPTLLKIAAGEFVGLRDIYLRIKAVEALGRMRVAEATTLLRRIVRERDGLTHHEPAALRAAAEETLGLLENRPSSARVPRSEEAHLKSGLAYARPRRYPRARLRSPLAAAVTGARPREVRVRTVSLGGALLESDSRFVIGESMRMEIRSGLRRIQCAAVVRNLLPDGAGVEFVHMKPEDRERLRRLVRHSLR